MTDHTNRMNSSQIRTRNTNGIGKIALGAGRILRFHPTVNSDPGQGGRCVCDVWALLSTPPPSNYPLSFLSLDMIIFVRLNLELHNLILTRLRSITILPFKVIIIGFFFFREWHLPFEMSRSPFTPVWRRLREKLIRNDCDRRENAGEDKITKRRRVGSQTSKGWLEGGGGKGRKPPDEKVRGRSVWTTNQRGLSLCVLFLSFSFPPSGVLEIMQDYGSTRVVALLGTFVLRSLTKPCH